MVNYPKDWEKTRLGNLCKIKTGTRNSEEKISNGVYPFFVRSDKVERINSFSYDTEAILVPGEGNIGSIYHYINGKFDVHQRVYAITNFSEEVSARYIYWFMFKYFGSYALQNTSKATVDSLRLPAFENFNVYYPDLPEQKAIAETLMGFDEHIENLEELIAKKKMIRDGAVEDLISGKTRLDGFLGEKELVELGEISKIKDGTHRTFKRIKNGKLLLSAKNIFNNTIVLNADESMVSDEDYKAIISNGFPQVGDILLSCVGTIGRCCILNINNVVFQRSVAFIRPFKANNKYLMYLLQSNVVQSQLLSMVNSSAQGGIYLGSLKKIEIRIHLDIKEQQAIADILTAMDEEIEDLIQEKEKIEKLKAGAMDDLLTGKIRLIKEA